MTTAATRRRRFRRVTLHVARALLFVLILVLIHKQHARLPTVHEGVGTTSIGLDQLRRFFPAAASQGGGSGERTGREILNASGESLGYVLQTSPDADHVIGFSGPTNTLIAFSSDDRIVGIGILSSGDTRDHVRQVRENEAFLQSFNGMTWEQAAGATQVDAVSGATLTSLAIRESIIFRLSGGRPSLRFPEPLTVNDARQLFESAVFVQPDAKQPSLWYVKDKSGAAVGSILRTSPHADNIIGYQGPTETLIGFDTGGRVIGITLGHSYDNEKYVTYVREDEYFLTLFNELLLGELAGLNLEEAGVEGVSGATMTSMAVAEGILAAAEQHRLQSAESAQPPEAKSAWPTRDIGTASVVIAGLAIGLTSLRGNGVVRVCFQLVLIGYLGRINGDMVSQAMIIGWAQNGVPWQNASGLVLLTIAAFAVPLTSRRNVYCTHLCPHGAAQQLLRNRLPKQLRLSDRFTRMLKLLPALILVWCLVVAMMALPFSLVDIEPFDAWVFEVAGWATISIAIVGLIASLFVPMAYCRYGCPTGALLEFLRFNARSDRWSRRDWVATGLVALAGGLWMIS